MLDHARWFGRALLRVLVFRRPTNDRNWSPDLVRLPEITFGSDGTVTIRSIRNFTYRSVTDYTPGYYDRTFAVSDIQTVWFMVEPFSVVAAHTLVSFGLSDGTYIAISVEIRKTVGQVFSQLAVLFFLRRHELVYVIGDERDLIRLRTNYRQDTVYLYPVQATPSQAQALLVDMLKRAQRLQQEPEFYNPFTNTCLTNIVAHANAIAPKRIPWSYKLLIATLADELAYSIGLLDQSLPFRQLRKKHLINDRAREYGDDPDFSQKIRV
ncbi:MAG: DUF4105 domain-containing protein [Candidatus Moranbacteria bacterium]|nr:DUF4105 domain-containing protein [Candidatus Moranbacteria bacterium]